VASFFGTQCITECNKLTVRAGLRHVRTSNFEVQRIMLWTVILLQKMSRCSLRFSWAYCINMVFGMYVMHVVVLQSYMSNNMLDFYETTPFVPVVITPTVPISCPPCSVTVRVAHLTGLTVSTCQLTFYMYDPPLTSRTINIRAVPTAGSNSRTTQLQFDPASTKVTGTGWDRYTISAIPVSDWVVKLFKSFNLLTGRQGNRSWKKCLYTLPNA